MQILVGCEQCLSEFPDSPLDYQFRPVTNDNNYEYKCKRGHTHKLILEIPSYEVLFEYGLFAFLDGYYREAITAFITSMEKYFELFIEVVQRENNVLEDVIDGEMKKLSRSELKLGAYIASYVYKNLLVPQTLSSDDQAFRNNVIHNGTFPTKEETIEWAKKIYVLIKPECEKLRSENKASYFRATQREYLRNLSKISKVSLLRPLKLGTLLSEMIYFKSPDDVIEYLEDIRKRREMTSDSYPYWIGRPF